MEYDEYLNKIIDDGIAAAKRDYSEPRQASKLKGSIAGFEACRGLQPTGIAALLRERHDVTRQAFRDRTRGSDAYWEIRCFEAEVEWVANCVSAVLMNAGQPVIINPTARGVMKAAEVVGVA